MKQLFFTIGMIIPLLVFAHGKEDHSGKKAEKAENQKGQQMHQKIDQTGQMKKLQIETINKNYQINVKGIFKQKCIDCHGVPEKYPWYYKVPGIKQIMDHDIQEAQEHLDMSNDFPFGGHGTPLSDLKELRKTVKKSSMPPLQYWIFHPGSRLNDKNKEIILQWIDQSINRLSQ
ncbi:MAG: hypothetical protein HN580_09795 [Deltaproteobacteria bacterium]|jgi:hypothetical protein|nr:hypothetical protein [Deltaproteobacteria bacterium]MBT4087622.1 hypothetical protein [Deltaproteobacteria bacterium]MBT4263246.1 hypothetical protein [Deltaproteobacteria bacterium]MBT4639021.1 hypothetical protein [Deltaproteobacteria bacterium]MBT6502281.1 hypothetical protein [Deltaproteobacteria bacterium]